MKRLHVFPVLALLLAASKAPAADYQINWAGFDGGGGSSSNPPLAHRGVVGGWLPVPVQSASYVLVPGAAAASPGDSPGIVPVLSIAALGENLRIAWAASAAGYVLESTSELGGAAVWSEVPSPVMESAGERYVLVPGSGARSFYRLRAL